MNTESLHPPLQHNAPHFPRAIKLKKKKNNVRAYDENSLYEQYRDGMNEVRSGIVWHYFLHFVRVRRAVYALLRRGGIVCRSRTGYFA